MARKQTRETTRVAPAANWPYYPPNDTHIQCARSMCNTSAICRVRTIHGWAAFCYDHYSEYWLDFAIRYNRNPAEVEAEQRKIYGPSYRERWYAERGLPYEPPRLDINAPPFQHAGDYTGDLINRLQTGELGPIPPRQPGEDETYTQP